MCNCTEHQQSQGVPAAPQGASSISVPTLLACTLTAATACSLPRLTAGSRATKAAHRALCACAAQADASSTAA